MLCGKARCPVLEKTAVMARLYLKYHVSDSLEGSSPPTVFVGRIGYPAVFVGPLAPPWRGDTSLMDLPEAWFGIDWNQLLEWRLAMHHGRRKVRVTDINNRFVLQLQDLTLSARPVDVEMVFRKPPRPRIQLSEEAQPFGPAATLRAFHADPGPADRFLERVYYDTDLRAADAILELYHRGVPVSRIQRVLSLGMLGTARWRRLVPTRWSITAVDDTIGRKLMEQVRRLPVLSEYLLYTSRQLGNLFMVILLPEAWSYELIEAWAPGSFWNPFRKTAAVGDYEEFRGRTTYARIGGCYYAARLAVCEHLLQIRRQATAIVLREIYPQYIMPVGVWNVRESVRQALRNPPLCFASLTELLDAIDRTARYGVQFWLNRSRLLQRHLRQQRLQIPT